MLSRLKSYLAKLENFLGSSGLQLAYCYFCHLEGSASILYFCLFGIDINSEITCILGYICFWLMWIKQIKLNNEHFAVRFSSCKWPMATFSGVRCKCLNGNSTEPQDSPEESSQTWQLMLHCGCKSWFCWLWILWEGCLFFRSLVQKGFLPPELLTPNLQTVKMQPEPEVVIISQQPLQLIFEIQLPPQLSRRNVMATYFLSCPFYPQCLLHSSL